MDIHKTTPPLPTLWAENFGKPINGICGFSEFSHFSLYRGNIIYPYFPLLACPCLSRRIYILNALELLLTRSISSLPNLYLSGYIPNLGTHTVQNSAGGCYYCLCARFRPHQVDRPAAPKTGNPIMQPILGILGMITDHGIHKIIDDRGTV